MILGLFWMVVANAATLLGAHAILRRVSTGKGHLDAAFFLVLRFALISAAVLIAGLTHSLTATGVGLMGLVALAALFAAGAHRQIRRPEFPDAGRLLTILTVIVAARLLAQVWVFAPYNYDAISYHLTKIAEWVRAGAFTREMGVDTHAPFPAGFELVETWWVVFLHHDVLIEMAGVEFLALACAGCYALARESGVTERWAYFAAFAYGLTPGLHLSATSCLNDVPVAALEVTTAAFVMARAPWAWIALVVGLGIGIKPTYGYALPGFLLLAYFVRRNPPPTSLSRKFAVAMMGWGAFLGLFWYGRNMIWFGSPIYPVGTGGLVAKTGLLKIQFGPSFSSALKNVSDLLESRVYDDFVAYGSLLNGISGWGALAFACGLAALLISLRTDPALRRIAMAFGVSLACVLLLVNHDDWYMRFVMFFPAVLSIAMAKLSNRLRPMLAIVGAALIFQFLATFFPVDLPLKSVKTLWSQGWRDRSAAAIYRADLPADSVAFFIAEPIHNRGESYLLYGPDYSRRVVYLRAKTVAEMIDEIDRERVRFLYRSRETEMTEFILQECIRQGHLRLVSGRLYERLQQSGR
jgi:hypothetical protein